MEDKICLRVKRAWPKYLAVFRISLANIFEYRVNFLVARIRNLILLLTLYFLWKTVFGPQQNLFGYTLSAMFTYVLAVHLGRGLILNSATIVVASEITGGGKFFSYLLRPVSYLKYWFTVDLAYKLIDLTTSIFEILVLIWLLKIPLFWQTNPVLILATIIAVFAAIILNFYLGYLVSLMAFWTPQAWGPRFLFDLLLSFSAGAFFPLDVFGPIITKFFAAFPFFYLLFFPINVYLGRVATTGIIVGLFVTFAWIAITAIIAQFIWQKGLRVYEGGGI